MTAELILGLSGLLMGGYIALFLLFLRGWYGSGVRRNLLVPEPRKTPLPLMSVIIPARNEEENIAACLASLSRQTYPVSSMEVIVVDDHSTDATAEQVRRFDSRFPVELISLGSESPKAGVPAFGKKAALTRGIRAAKGEIILTTDADTEVPETWVEEMSRINDHPQAQMVLGPVKYKADLGLLGVFQTLDFMAMQGITVAVNHLRIGIMGNGANLGFRKSAFDSVGGYVGVDHLASGDDYLLMAKIREHYGPAFLYLNSPKAMVTTLPPRTWKAFLAQRVRWASKTGRYKDPFLHGCLLCVYLVNAMMLGWALYGLGTGKGAIPLLFMALKLMAELLLLLPVARFFRQSYLLWFYPLLQPLHWIYILVAGTLGWQGEYHWKGRRTR